MNQHPLVSALVVTALLCGCAALPQDQNTATAAPKNQRCAQVTGSNICRTEGSGRMSDVESVSGDALRNSPDALTGPVPTKVGN